MTIREMCWHQKSGEWFMVEKSGGEFVKAARLDLATPLRHSEIRSALMGGFAADPRVLAAIQSAPEEYAPVWENNAGAILPVGDVAIPSLADDYPPMDSSHA